ncbi:MAG: hypothetical protein JSU68_13795 [Phycisphaerales bacterium]|nr:MAG: hypothetical protein JSU68_13795 [Phycisphaerales bacterium]
MKRIFVPVICSALLACTSMRAAAQAQGVDSVIPSPKKIVVHSSTAVEIGSGWKIAVDMTNQDDLFSANYLQQAVKKVSEVTLPVTGLDGSGERILMGNPYTDGFLRVLAENHGIMPGSEGFGQGYTIRATPDRLFVLGNGSAGTFYGAVTASALLRKSESGVSFPDVTVADWPDVEIRAFYGECLADSGYYSDEKQWADLLTRYKFNMWIPPRARRKKGLDGYLQRRHFVLVANTNLLATTFHNRDCIEGVFAHGRLRFVDDVAVPLEESLVLANPGFEVEGLPGWRFTPGHLQEQGKYKWDITDLDSHSGGHAARLQVIAPIVHSSGYLMSDRYDVPADRTFFFSFWGKISGDSGQVTLVARNASKDVVFTVSRSVEAGEWTEYQFPCSTTDLVSTVELYSRVMDAGPLTLWLDDFNVVELDNKLAGVLRTSDTKLEVWNTDKSVKYQEGPDYLVASNGKALNFVSPLEGKRLSLRRVPSGNIPTAGEIAVTYDFAVNFQPPGRYEYCSFADPATYDTFRTALVKPAFGRFDYKYVFLGMDEIRGFNRDGRAEKAGRANCEALAEGINRAVAILKGFNPDVKVMMWDDMLNPWHNGDDENYQLPYGGKPGRTSDAARLLDKSVIPVTWWYSEDCLGTIRNAGPFYRNLGLRYMGGAFAGESNLTEWSRDYEGSLGLIKTEWGDDVSNMNVAAECFWNKVRAPATEPGAESPGG